MFLMRHLSAVNALLDVNAVASPKVCGNADWQDIPIVHPHAYSPHGGVA